MTKLMPAKRRTLLAIAAGLTVVTAPQVASAGPRAGGSYQLRATVPVACWVRPNTALMAETGRMGGGRIELGELTEGGTNLPLQVWVKSTGGYRVVVSSRNKGRLVLAEDSSWWVPYRLSLNSRPINLGIGGHVESRKGTGMNEDAYDLQLQVGETARRRAGLYSDLIELTVAPI
ncbi:hypothetical protein [Brevundimonas naejangsanensis]|uniref:hypothetical protein n=1 Tax=Brevundimonas naejangsanensis TaxID=588932 RepID=UPI00106BBAFF|nr:hypothetical protein [Brevundimonas naejangsanensis]QBQ47556.1 hypothetical protein E3U41_01985 [Brevundimonas naejangsanensis]